ncbi:Fc.00g006990.m01.CDS01 [Cosmosporella sp. VM-42]
MYSQQPSWLKSIVNDATPAPRLFAWDLSNIDSKGDPDAPSSYPKDDLDRRIFVLGVGNLGRLFSSCLVQAPDSPPITLVVHRQELLTQYMASEGIEILRNGILEKQKIFDIEWWTETPPHYGPVREVSDGEKLRNLIVTTKATAALPQVDRVRRYLDRDSTIAFAQNGMSKLWPPYGPAYALHRYNDGDAPNFLACVTTHGVTSQGLFKSFHASQADVVIGPVLPNAESSQQAAYLTKQVITAPHLDGRPASRAELWVLQLEKLVVNSIINPLTAILGFKNGVLFTEPSGVIERIIDQLLVEASLVLQALVSHESSAEIIAEAPLTHDYQATIDTSQQSLRERFSQPQLRDLIYRVGHKVRENTSSMLQDVRAGNPTEIRDFNGWIVETAAFLDQNLDSKGHQALIDLVESGKKLDVDQLGAYFHISGGGF